MNVPQDLIVRLKIYALQAIPWAQEQALKKAGGMGVPANPQAVMVAYVMEKYAALTAATPLAFTDFDDKAVKQVVTGLVAEAEAKIGGAVGEFIHAPVLDDKTLKHGGLL